MAGQPNFQEIHGLPPDPDCLHCTLVPMIAAQLRRKQTAQVIGELLQSVADLIGSSTMDVEQDIADAQLLIERLTRQSHVDFRQTRDRPS